MCKILCCCFSSTQQVDESSSLVESLTGTKKEFDASQVRIRECSREIFKYQVAYDFHKHHRDVLTGASREFSIQALSESHLEAFETNVKNRAKQRGGIVINDTGDILDRERSDYSDVLTALLAEKQKDLEEILLELENDKAAHIWTVVAVEEKIRKAHEMYDKLQGEQEQNALRMEDLREMLKYQNVSREER